MSEPALACATGRPCAEGDAAAACGMPDETWLEAKERAENLRVRYEDMGLVAARMGATGRG